MTVELWLVRHGETDWNKLGLYQGEADIPLNATGLAQAAETARVLAACGHGFDAIYSSPLSRARQTGDAAARLLNLPVREDARLCEIHMGEWQGQNYREVVTRFKAAGTNLPQVCAPGGEPVAAVARRMTGCVTDIALAHPGARVLIFSHGLALSALICTARRIPLEQVYEHIPRNGKADVITWPPAPEGLIQMPTC